MKLRKARNALDALAGKTIRIRADYGGGLALVGTTKPLPADHPNLIVADASIRVRGTYKALASTGKALRQIRAAQDYSGLDVHVWRRACGRQLLADRDARSPLLETVAELIRERPDEPWLIICPEIKFEFAPDQIEAVSRANCLFAALKGMLPRIDLRCVYWGNHHGSNGYRDCKNVVVFGLNEYRQVTYEALQFAALGGVKPCPLALDEMKAAEVQHNLLQAICRSHVRRSTLGRCGDCSVYLIGHRADLTSLVAETFPGCRVHEWQPVAPTLKGKVAEVVGFLRWFFSDPDNKAIPKSEVKARLGIGDAVFSRTIKKREVEEALGELGVIKEWGAFRRSPDTTVTQGAEEMAWKIAA